MGLAYSEHKESTMSTATPSALTADEIAANKQSADEEFAEAVETRFLEIAADAEVVTDDRIDKKLDHVTQRVRDARIMALTRYDGRSSDAYQ